LSSNLVPIAEIPAPPKRRLLYHLENTSSEGKSERFLRAFAAVLHYGDYKTLLDAYSASSAKCSRCVVMCPLYQVTNDPQYIPCVRAGRLLDVYKRHFTVGGWLGSRVGARPSMTDDDVDEIADLFYRCTVCRRCSLECPMGLDHGLITRLGRYVLSMAGIAPKALQVSVREQLEGTTRNTSKVPTPALIDTLEFLGDELEGTVGAPLRFPIDQFDREYVFFCAVSDYLMEPDTLMGNAAVIHAAGDWENWTIGSGNFDGINYGLFYNDWHLERIVRRLLAEAHRLRGRKILIGECGHASRTAREFVPVFGGSEALPVVSFLEYTLEQLEKGKIQLDPDVVTERVTYHDPCNLARSGWLVEQPRQILRAFVKNFVEMEPHGRANYCCGGGGGLVSMNETQEFRMTVAGQVKADQIRRTGAQLVVAPCANCKKQLKELVAHHKIPCEVVGMHDLILRAINVPDGPSAKERQRRRAEPGAA